METDRRRLLYSGSILIVLLFVICVYSLYNVQSSTSQHIFLINSTVLPRSRSIPTIARVLYLFLCENQAEIDAYKNAFPSVTADVMFFCWKENCFRTNFSKFNSIYIATWLGPISELHQIVRFDPAYNYVLVHPRIFIINERQLNLSHRTTWTTARNILYNYALAQELRQGWRWSYFNFADGDVHIVCPLAEKMLNSNTSTGDELILVQQFRSLVNLQKSLSTASKTDICFLLMDTFLLSVSPAIGVIAGMFTPIIYNGLLAQVVYHVDAMFNAFHRDALDFVLPYCPRYDASSWWKSQAILVYRSFCLYGHVIQFNALNAVALKHGKYPRDQDPWKIDQDMNLVPSSLIPLQMYMKNKRIVSPLVLRHYNGWSLKVTSVECRDQHRYLDPLNCTVRRKKA